MTTKQFDLFVIELSGSVAKVVYLGSKPEGCL
jgi:hypothetical protein